MHTIFTGHSFIRSTLNLPEPRSFGMQSGHWPEGCLPARAEADMSPSICLFSIITNFYISVLGKKREGRGVTAQVCRLLHVLGVKKKPGRHKNTWWSPVLNALMLTGGIIHIPPHFHLFLWYLRYATLASSPLSKHELLLGTSSARAGAISIPPHALPMGSALLCQVPAYHRDSHLNWKMHCKPRRVISWGGIYLLQLQVSAM